MLYSTNLIHTNLSAIRLNNPIPYNTTTTTTTCSCQLKPLSPAISSPEPTLTSKTEEPFIVNYLVKTFGFSQEKAFSASKYLQTTSTRTPELVKAFLENEGLTPDQIGSVVRFFPRLLKYDPERNLLPKVEFFRSLGIPQSEIKNIFITAPAIFGRSLTRHVIPTFTYIEALFKSSGTSLGFSKRLGAILPGGLEAHLIPNVETLREVGVPDANIVYLLQTQPRALIVDSEKFRKVVEDVRKMDICPSKLKFIIALHTIRSMTKSTWDTKVAAYKKWGWSDDDVVLAFQRYPGCMMLSTDKITKFMDFMVNEMGFESSLLLKNPSVLSLSLENRIKPRCWFYKVLVDNGLIIQGSYFPSIFVLSDDKFFKRFVQRYGTKVPGLMQLYAEKEAVTEEFSALVV